MKTLVALCALVACVAAQLPFSYSTGYAGLAGLAGYGYGYSGLINSGLIGAPGLYASSRLLAAPAIAAPAIAAPAIAAPAIAAPVLARTAPIVAPAAPMVTKSQWHAQNELGMASYGHAEPLQTHTATQDAHGNKVGSFSYLNPTDGQIHRTDYVADAAGYRVAANDLPIDTPEVALAKSAHLAAHLRARRGLGYPIAAHPYSIAAAPLGISAYNLHAAPAAYSAIQTTIVNNPGHAVSYRID